MLNIWRMEGNFLNLLKGIYEKSSYLMMKEYILSPEYQE